MQNKKNDTHNEAIVDEPAGNVFKPDDGLFPVVGIGASAGGLEALEGFLAHLEPGNDICYIVVSHQLPGHISLLSELLAGFTGMPVMPAKSAMPLKKNQVFVCPPGHKLAVFNRQLHLMGPGYFHANQLPIDYFFRSLAEDIKHHAVAVILSGTGSDGTLGLKAIKGQGGLTMAQDPDTAKFRGMPDSAIASGEVDFVLPVESMGRHLSEYVKGGFFNKFDQLSSEQLISYEPIQKIFILIRNKTGHDLSAYKPTTIRRRIIRRMNIHKIETVNEYIVFLQENPHEIDALFKELLINVTNFFRDPEVFQMLVQEGLPRLLESKPDHYELRIWIPGCATGEEAYSISMLLKEFRETHNKMFNYQIFATDLDESAINKAREGIYPSGIEADVSPRRLQRFFNKENDNYRIAKEIRETIVFATQNLIKDPPFTHIDLISCRNLLIYMNSELQKALFPQLHYALNQDGLLLLGTSESIGSFDELFTVLDKKWKLYQRKDVAVPLPISKLNVLPVRKEHQSFSTDTPLTVDLQANPISRHIEKLLLQRFVPVSVIVNEHGKIIYVHGRTGEYLELAPGQPNINIVELAREGLRLPLTAMLREARKGGHTDVVSKRVKVKTNGEFKWVDIRLFKVTEPEAIRDLLLISFLPCQTEKVQALSSREIAFSENDERTQLEEELYFTKESLRATIEELETSNEELKSANEELQSTNEELQSSNEELETSREEMQSLNEELSTVNSELQNKVVALSLINDDMQNLLNATDIATIFLDNDLKIKRFTRHATKLIKLIETDVGRPLTDLVFNLKYDNLITDAQNVLKTLIFKDIEVQSLDGNWYLLRILPYRTAENMINGLVIIFIDINKIKCAEKRFQDAEMARAIVQKVNHPLLVLDSDFNIMLVNPAFCGLFQQTAEAMEFRDLFTVDQGAWDEPKLRAALNKTRTQNVAFDKFYLCRDFTGIGRKQLLLSGCVLTQLSDKTPSILLGIEELPEPSSENGEKTVTDFGPR